MNEQITKIQLEITQQEQSAKAALDKMYLTQRQAEKDYYQELALIPKTKEQLTEKYRDFAEELMDYKKVAPYSRYGNQLDPDTVEATAEGMYFFWDAEDHWNCVSHTIPWEEILEAEKKRL